jgi:hypothetical protein
MQEHLSKILGAAVICIAAVFVCRWWTYPPAVEFDNLKYVQLLRTAVSARNSEWLAGVERAVRQRHQSGEMSLRELEHFEQLITQAREGDWAGTDRHCVAFEGAQLSRARNRPASPETAHDHAHKGSPPRVAGSP